MPIALPEWGFQGLDSEDMKFGDVLFNLASGSESKTTCPFPAMLIGAHPFILQKGMPEG